MYMMNIELMLQPGQFADYPTPQLHTVKGPYLKFHNWFQRIVSLQMVILMTLESVRNSLRI